MRIAVLSDIHSNLAALEAVLGDLPTVHEAWILGDIVGYGPQPNEVIRTLQALGARSVLGNHDGAAVGTVDPDAFNPDARRAIEWTAEVIDANARSYLASLPEVRRDGQLTAVHGSPRDPIWEYIFTEDIAAQNLGAFETTLCLFGHTHFPIIYAADEDEVVPLASTPDVPIEVGGRRALVNPGSVGQPRDGNPAASYLILDTDDGNIQFRRVRYDIERTQRLMRDVGLPLRLVERLSYGR
jgi:diadenosine tetraphosphatase ApaH/serine/threonine PP2A family protein phosphatase